MPTPGPQASPGVQALQKLAPKWKEAISRQVIQDAKDERARGPPYDAYGTQAKADAPKPAPRRYSSWADMSGARLALGAGWVPDTTDKGIAGGVPVD